MFPSKCDIYLSVPKRRVPSSTTSMRVQHLILRVQNLTLQDDCQGLELAPSFDGGGSPCAADPSDLKAAAGSEIMPCSR